MYVTVFGGGENGHNITYVLRDTRTHTINKYTK